MATQNNLTTRRLFLKNSAATAAGAAFLLKSLSVNASTAAQTNRGNPPVVTTTPWGQKVQHDTSTYIEMQKYIHLKKNQKWDDGVSIARQIRAQIKSGELVIQNPPIRLLTGLWVLCGDSQQRTYLADTGSGLTQAMMPSRKKSSGKSKALATNNAMSNGYC